jgi:hypothetical protein
MGRKLAFILCFLAVIAFPAVGQEQDSTDTDPEEYVTEEFSPLLQDLRRAEIILLGSFPITLFLSLEIYDTYRYIKNGGDYQYAPWPFRPPDAAGYSSGENIGIIISAASVSLLIAVVDYLIGRRMEKRSEH